MPTDPHVFGGGWTDEKLSILSRYLDAYTTALRNQPFRKLYIDAFAGTGRREDSAAAKARKQAIASGQLQFTVDNDPEVDGFLDGSATIALKSTPPFDQYIFIEKRASRCRELEDLKKQFPALSNSIAVFQDDANDAIQRLTAEEWRSRRAVLFLDPYGVQVKWETIVAIAQTKAIDLWVLFPLSGVNRMLTNDGQIPDAWRAKLNDLLGTNDWDREFYRADIQPVTPSLFEDAEPDPPGERMVKQRVQVIADYFLAFLPVSRPYFRTSRMRQQSSTIPEIRRFSSFASRPETLREAKSRSGLRITF